MHGIIVMAVSRLSIHPQKTNNGKSIYTLQFKTHSLGNNYFSALLLLLWLYIYPLSASGVVWGT